MLKVLASTDSANAAFVAVKLLFGDIVVEEATFPTKILRKPLPAGFAFITYSLYCATRLAFEFRNLESI